MTSHSQHSLPGYAFLHDFTVTQQYYVIFHNPVTFHLKPFVLGQKGAVHSVCWNPHQPLTAHLIHRPPCPPLTSSSPHPDPLASELPVPPSNSKCNDQGSQYHSSVRLGGTSCSSNNSSHNNMALDDFGQRRQLCYDGGAVVPPIRWRQHQPFWQQHANTARQHEVSQGRVTGRASSSAAATAVDQVSRPQNRPKHTIAAQHAQLG